MKNSTITRLIGVALAAVLLLSCSAADGATAQPIKTQPVRTPVRVMDDPYRYVMPLGDSITAGHGDPQWNGYRGELYGRLRDNSFRIDNVGSCPHSEPLWKCPYRGTHWDYQHEGHSGWRIDQIRTHIDLLTQRYQPEVVLLHLGTNDLGQSYDVPNAPARLRDLVERIRYNLPAAHIFVAGIVRSKTNINQTELSNYINATASMVNTLRSAGDLKVHFVPQQIIGDEAGDLGDGVHPSICGYAKMAYVWWLYMRNSPLGGGIWPQTRPNPFYDTSGPCAAQLAAKRSR
jgi:acyl-CoA thioesterase-1